MVGIPGGVVIMITGIVYDDGVPDSERYGKGPGRSSRGERKTRSYLLGENLSLHVLEWHLQTASSTIVVHLDGD